MSYIIASIQFFSMLFEFFSDNYMNIILYSINFFIVFYIKYDYDFLNLFFKNFKTSLFGWELFSQLYYIYINEIKKKK